MQGLDDGFEVRGVPTRLRGGDIDAAGDHRIAMLGAVAGACSQSGVTIEGAEALGSQLPRLRRAAGGRVGMIVTIDGPAGVGKSTVARRIAEALGRAVRGHRARCTAS